MDVDAARALDQGQWWEMAATSGRKKLIKFTNALILFAFLSSNVQAEAVPSPKGGVIAVAVPSTDPKRSTDFYQNYGNFGPGPRFNAHESMLLSPDQNGANIILYETAKLPENGIGKVMVIIGVADAAAVAVKLKADGKVVREHSSNNILIVTTQDPDGNIVEFMQR